MRSRFVHSFMMTCVVIAAWSITAVAQPKSITILHTNDMHAAFVPHEATWVKDTPRPMVGGFKELQFKIDSIRATKDAVLLLDAGDVMTGNPITEFTYKGVYGGALFEMMNRIGYDGWTFGNHDLDISQQNLIERESMVTFPTICANVVNDKGEFPLKNKPYVIFERGGLRIGVIGLMSQELYNLVNQNNLVGLRVLSPIETCQKYVNELRPKTDLVIALTHQGVDDDAAMAAAVTGLDVIVGGHSHTRLPKPKIVNDVLIVQTGSNCESLGQLDLTVDQPHHLSYHWGKLISLYIRTERKDVSVGGLVDSMQAMIEKDYAQKIATLKDDWIRGNGQTAIGSFIAEAQMNAAHAQVGFMNNHGIRKDMHAGPMTKKDLFEILPFRNILVTFQVTGQELKQIMTFQIKEHPGLQISGMNVSWKRSGDDVTFTRFEVQSKTLQDDERYICAASDFLVGEAKKYLGIEVPKPIFLKQTVFSAVEDAVKKAGTISARVPYTLEEVH